MLPNLKHHKDDKVYFDDGVNVFISKNC